MTKLRYAPAEEVNTPAKLQAYLDITDSQMRTLQMALAATRVSSLDKTVNSEDDASTWGDFIADESSEPSLDELDMQLALQELEAALPQDLELVKQAITTRSTTMAKERGVARQVVSKQVATAKQRLRSIVSNPLAA